MGTDLGRDAGRRPRHCMVVLAYYPLAETRVQREAEALVRTGYEVDVICLRERGEPKLEFHRGVTVRRVDVRLRKENLARQFVNYLHFFVRAGTLLTALHARRPYDCVQVHNLPDFLVFCAAYPRLRGVPVVLDLHDLMPEFYAGRFSGTRGRRLVSLVRLQERLACRFADHVITVSDHWRRALVDRGVPPSKCSVVMNLADEDVFTEPVSAPRDDSSFELIYHGTVAKRYGLDLAVRAVAKLRDLIPEIHLTILGKGDHMDELRALRRELAIEGHVTLRDEFLTAEQLPAIIARADLGVVPYRNDVFTDGLLPTKLMEYAAMGVPCVASRTTAIESYFDGANVELFEPGDVDDLAERIRVLHDDPARRAEVAARARVFTHEYNWESTSRAYVATIHSLRSRTPAATRAVAGA